MLHFASTAMQFTHFKLTTTKDKKTTMKLTRDLSRSVAPTLDNPSKMIHMSSIWKSLDDGTNDGMVSLFQASRMLLTQRMHYQFLSLIMTCLHHVLITYFLLRCLQ